MYCRPTPAVGLALLLLPGLVEDQHRAGRGQVPDGEAAYGVAGGVLVPDCLVEQALQSEGTGRSGVLGDHPAVLAWQVGQQTAQVVQRVCPRLTASEERGEVGREVVELLLEQ